MDRFLDLFETDNGVIVFNNKNNLTASEAITKIFDQFNSSQMNKYLNKFVKDISEITDMSIKYHSTMAESVEKFKTISERVRNKMSFRLGIDNKGRNIKNGFLNRFAADTGLKNSVINKVVEGISKQISKKDMLSLLKTHIKGDKPLSGALVKRFKTTIHDVYSQYDRSMSKEFATDLKLKAFIYAGGIINESRRFCIKRNNKVFTIEEAEKWVDDPDLPKTKAEKKSGKVVGYDPLINMGRWMGDSESCRHHPSFISNAEAIRLRPDLEGKL